MEFSVEDIMKEIRKSIDEEKSDYSYIDKGLDTRVSQIMRKIREEYEASDCLSMGKNINNEKIREIVADIEKSNTVIMEERKQSEPYLNLFNENVPIYSRFGHILEKMINFIAKYIRKFVKYMFENQVIVNHSVDTCICTLADCQMQLRKAYEYIDLLEMQNKDLEHRIDDIYRTLNENCTE